MRSVFKGSFANTPAQVNYVANVDDMQILNGAGLSKVAAVHHANPSATVYMYQKIGGLHGPDSVPPAGDPGWSSVSSQDLLWYGPSGVPVTHAENGWYYVDIIDPAKRAAWTRLLLSNIQAQLAAGYDAVFLDNADVIDPTLITEYPSNYTDAAYYQAVGEVLASLGASLPGRRIIINSYTGAATPGNRGLELLASADGLFFEGFSMKASSAFFAERSRYMQQLDDFAAVVASGKMAIAMDYAASTDGQRRMWSLASYLLVNSPRSYHYFAATDVTADLQSYPENALAIGVPVTDAIDSVDGLVTRSYTGATVIANPSTATIDYTLPDDSWEQLALDGGGVFPDTGKLSWLPVHGLSIPLAPNTAAVTRHRSAG